MEEREGKGIISEKHSDNGNGQIDTDSHGAQLRSSATIGAYLQEQRTSRGIGLEEVSEATGISTGVLRALENENREELPAEVYIKAFYKKYIKYLGLDPEEIYQKYHHQSGNQKKARRGSDFSTVITLKGQEENLFADTLRRLFLPLVIILLGVLFYWIYNNYLTPGS